MSPMPICCSGNLKAERGYLLLTTLDASGQSIRSPFRAKAEFHSSWVGLGTVPCLPQISQETNRAGSSFTVAPYTPQTWSHFLRLRRLTSRFSKDDLRLYPPYITLPRSQRSALMPAFILNSRLLRFQGVLRQSSADRTRQPSGVPVRRICSGN